MPVTHYPALGVKTLSLYSQADSVEAHPPPPISFWAVKRDQEVVISQYSFSLSSTGNSLQTGDQYLANVMQTERMCTIFDHFV